MAALLGAMRRERNGAVADAMRFIGRPYGLNYGVSLPTLRTLARAEGRDHAFARYLYLQQVRELRLAAFHIADPAQVSADEFPFWAEGLLNSEMAEEGAFALFGALGCFPAFFGAWTAPDAEPLLQYAAMMAAARREEPSQVWITPAVDAVRRAAGTDLPEARLLAQGAVALLAALVARGVSSREEVLQAAVTLGTHPAEEYVREELAWRLEA